MIHRRKAKSLVALILGKYITKFILSDSVKKYRPFNWPVPIKLEVGNFPFGEYGNILQ